MAVKTRTSKATWTQRTRACPLCAANIKGVAPSARGTQPRIGTSITLHTAAASLWLQPGSHSGRRHCGFSRSRMHSTNGSPCPASSAASGSRAAGTLQSTCNAFFPDVNNTSVGSAARTTARTAATSAAAHASCRRCTAWSSVGLRLGGSQDPALASANDTTRTGVGACCCASCKPASAPGKHASRTTNTAAPSNVAASRAVLVTVRKAPSPAQYTWVMPWDSSTSSSGDDVVPSASRNAE